MFFSNHNKINESQLSDLMINETVVKKNKHTFETFYIDSKVEIYNMRVLI